MIANNPTQPLRYGVLGAARIAPKALVNPVRKIESATVTRVAARDVARAEAFAAEHGVEGFAASYTELIEACLLYTSPSPRDQRGPRMPSSA